MSEASSTRPADDQSDDTVRTVYPIDRTTKAKRGSSRITSNLGSALCPASSRQLSRIDSSSQSKGFIAPTEVGAAPLETLRADRLSFATLSEFLPNLLGFLRLTHV